MTDKIVTSGGVTISNIKNCTFKEQVNTETNLRFGACAASSIEFEVFDAQENAVAVGDVLTYYQTDENGTDTLIGKFIAQTSIPARNIYRVVAYDNIIKLETDFSEHLASIQEDFPMSVADLLAEVETVAGVTFGNSPTLASTTVQELAASGVTCRQIVSWAAEMSGQFVRCDTSGNICFDWYSANSDYQIYPTSGSSGGVTYVPYRQGGLDYKNYSVATVDRVAVKPTNEEDVAYIYPTNATGNTYIVRDNLLLTNADGTVMSTVAQTLYTVLSALPTYRPMSASLFRSENPLRAGDIVDVEDIQGVAFTALIMSMTVSNSGAGVACTGNETYDTDNGGSVQKQLVNLADNIVRINKLKVDWAEINTAIINYLTAHDVTAQNLTIVDANDDVIATFNDVGITFYNDGAAVANYNDNAVTLGETSQSHAVVDYNSFELFDKNGNTYLSVGDLRGSNGTASVAETHYQLSSGVPSIATTFEIASVQSVTVDGVPTQNYTYSGRTITMLVTVEAGSVVECTYSTTAPVYHYDLGTRTGTTGAYSVAMGHNATATGTYSAVAGGSGNGATGARSFVGGGNSNTANGVGSTVGGGSNNTASGTNAVVGGGDGNTVSAMYNATVCGGSRNTASENNAFVGGGSQNVASGNGSVIAGGHNNEVRGYASVITGGENNQASGGYSSVLGGGNNVASGRYSSVVGGHDNTANRKSQTVFGEYNVAETSGAESSRGNYIEIVGNGTADNARSNARTLDWNGNERLAGTLYVNGTNEVATKADITNWSFQPNNTSTLTSQIDALTENGVYGFYILSYGHQTETGMPENGNFYGYVFRGSANYITVIAITVGGVVPYMLRKNGGTWATSWVKLALETDIPVLARETFAVKTSFTAGTIGTRGAQVTIDATKTGYTLIGAWIVYIEDSSSYHPLVFRAGSPATRVYVNIYRCVSTAVSDIDVTVECLYLKN